MARERLGNWEEANDLAQDVFIKAFRSLHQLEVPAAFGSWVRTITSRLASNQRSRRRRPIEMEQETFESVCIDSHDPLGGIMAEEQRLQVHQGLGRLTALDRATLEAFYLEGQSLIEMSDAFDAPIGTIKRRLHVARKRLAEKVEALQAV